MTALTRWLIASWTSWSRRLIAGGAKEVFTGAAPSAINDNNRRNVGAIVSEVIPKYGPFTDPEASAAVRYAKEVKALLG